MEIVPRVRSLDDHDEKIAAVVKITIAHRRLEEMTVLLNPVVQIDGRLHRGCSRGFGLGLISGLCSDNAAYLRQRKASNIRFT